jgi:hypothetical protein
MSQAATTTDASARASASTAAATTESRDGPDAAVLPSPALSAQHARLLAEADRTCRSDHDCACVARPPFLDVRVIVARAAASELEAIAADFRSAGCPPVTVAQPSPVCKPVCRKGQCVNK